jgi:uncharacterized protein YndB with AHSA1/START domain
MKENKISIVINYPVKEVFEYSTNPINTPKWFDSIAVEESSEYPPTLGTKYRSHSGDGNWGEYIVSDIKPNETFQLSSKDKIYHVRYTYKELGDNKTEIEYFEWVNEAELDDVVGIEVLEKLKKLLED